MIAAGSQWQCSGALCYLRAMKGLVAALLAAFFAATMFALEEELPTPDEGLPPEIEPPLLIQNRAADGSLPGGNPNAEELDVAKIAKDLARAEKNAGAGERLYKAGIISQVEAEERALKLVRLQAKLAEARVQQAKNRLEDLKTQQAARVVPLNDVDAAEALVTETAEAAERAVEGRRRAETEAAARNVQRQRKLLALGSGRKADLSKAQRTLTELQQPAQ